MKFTSKSRVAAVTVGCVLAWYLVVLGIAWLVSRGSSRAAMPVLFLFGAPILPGASACMVVGAHSNACVPASVVGNVVFYLSVVFIVRGRRTRRMGESRN